MQKQKEKHVLGFQNVHIEIILLTPDDTIKYGEMLLYIYINQKNNLEDMALLFAKKNI